MRFPAPAGYDHAKTRTIALSDEMMDKAQACMAFRGIRYVEGTTTGLTPLVKALLNQEFRRILDLQRAFEGAPDETGLVADEA